MAWFEVFIPSLDGGSPGITLTLEAPNWIGALRTGLQNIGEGQASISNVMCDIKEDNSIHVTDVASHRIFRLREVPKPGAAPLVSPTPKPTPTAPPPPATATTTTASAPGSAGGSGFSTGPKTLLDFQRPDFSKLPPPAPVHATTAEDHDDPDTIQTEAVDSITAPSSPPAAPVKPVAATTVTPMGGGQSTIEMSIPWATMPPPSSSSPLPGVTLAAPPTMSLPPAMSQAVQAAPGPPSPRAASVPLDAPTNTTAKPYDLTLRQPKAPGPRSTAEEPLPSSVPRDISLPPSAPVTSSPVSSSSSSSPPAGVFPPLPPLAPSDKTAPSQPMPSPPAAAPLAPTSPLITMPTAPRPAGTAPVIAAAPAQPSAPLPPVVSFSAPAPRAPAAPTPVAAPVQQKATAPAAPASKSAPAPDVTERLPRAPGRGPVPSPTPRGTTAPPPKRASGQFESAPQPVSREVSRENPVLTPATKVSAAAIADAVADVFDATQDLLMEGAVEPRRVAEALLDIALAHVPAESGSFYLADLNGHVLSFAAVRGPKADAIRRGKFTVPVGQGIIGFCALEGICLRVADMQKDPHYAATIANAVGYAVKDTLCASAEKDGRLYGAVQLINAKGTFTAAHMEVLRYIGLTAAQLLERHYENA